MLKLQIQPPGTDTEIDVDLLKKVFGVLADRFLDRDGQINLGFVDDKASQDLNKQYAGKDEPTDVLSFSYSEDGAAIDSEELGDVVINTDAATRQAGDYGLDVSHESALLLVHGILHLLGYDHQNKAQQRQMDDIQRRVLAVLGLPQPDFWRS